MIRKTRLTILDIGCGYGRLKYFCDFGEIEWHGIEIAENRFKASENLGYRMYRCDIDENPLPFDDANLDIVVGSHVLEHLVHRDFALQEMFRVLKPGGLLIIGVPVKPPLVSGLINRYYGSKSIKKGGTRHAFDLKSLKRFFYEVLGEGYQIIDIRGFRLISARKRFNWENSRLFYRANVWFGRTFPALTPEVNMIFRKR